MNELLMKMSGTDVLSSWKKDQKNLKGGGGGGVSTTNAFLDCEPNEKCLQC